MTIDQFAKQHGYLGAKYEGTWKNYDVYKPILEYDNMKIGYPLRILNNKNELRMTTSLESIEYLRYKNVKRD